MFDLSQIIDELKQHRNRLDEAIDLLQTTQLRNKRSNIGDKDVTRHNGRRGRRTMSAAAKRRISLKMKARWANAKKAGRNAL